jgi:hypothetical protein
VHCSQFTWFSVDNGDGWRYFAPFMPVEELLVTITSDTHVLDITVSYFCRLMIVITSVPFDWGVIRQSHLVHRARQLHACSFADGFVMIVAVHSFLTAERPFDTVTSGTRICLSLSEANEWAHDRDDTLIVYEHLSVLVTMICSLTAVHDILVRLHPVRT